MAQLTLHIRFWANGRRADALGDGLNYWAGPFLALHDQYSVLFNPIRYEAWFANKFGLYDHVWSYPPSYLLILLGLGVFHPPVAVLMFSALSSLALWIALRMVPLSSLARFAVLVSPAALTSMGGGQNGALLASLIIGGLFLAETSPLLGGAIAGLATIKPQLGLLIPVYWVAARRWRALISATLSASALVLLSLAVFPGSVWPDFLHQVLPFMGHLGAALAGKAAGGPRAMIASTFSMARQLGVGAQAGNILQLASTLLAVGGAAWLGWSNSLPCRFRLAGLLVLGPLSTPYIWCYDMIPASCGIALLLAEPRLLTFPAFLFLGLAWVTPGLALYAAIYGAPTFMPLWLLVGLGCWLAAWRSRQLCLNERFQSPGPRGKGAP